MFIAYKTDSIIYKENDYHLYEIVNNIRAFIVAFNGLKFISIKNIIT